MARTKDDNNIKDSVTTENVPDETVRETDFLTCYLNEERKLGFVHFSGEKVIPTLSTHLTKTNLN